MKLHYIIFLLLFTGCNQHGAVDFYTACGLMVGEGYDPSTIQRIEDLSIQAGLVTCSSISGYFLEKKHPDDPTKNGMTFCLSGLIQIAPDSVFVLQHELHHVQQHCFAGFKVDPGLDLSHADWDRTGAWDSIRWVAQTYLDIYGVPPEGQ